MKNLVRALLRKAGFELTHSSPDPVLSELRQIHNRLRLAPDQTLWADILSQPASHSCLRRLLQHHRITHLIDVGANCGQFGMLSRRLGFGGQIISFEPQSALRRSLEQLAAQNGPWKVVPVALGDREEELTLNIYQDDSFSSLHDINEAGRERFSEWVQLKATERVPVRRLDDLLGQLSLDKLDSLFLKTDTQGHDMKVLMGAEKLLARTKGVLVEASVQRIYSNSADATELFAWLERKGFALAGLFPISHQKTDLSLIEMDAFFTRRA